MARLPYVDPTNAPEKVRAILESLPVRLNVFRMLAHAETNFRPMLRLGTSILAEQKLSAKIRELAILRVAALSAAPYEWVQHVPIALAAGATEAQIDAIERGELDDPCFDAEERVVLRFTAELVREVRVSDGTFSTMLERFGPREIVELILAVGFYMTMARLMEATAIDLDPPAGQEIYRHARRTSRRED
jgi:alkylhydroperoxidase family enzyme